MEGYEAATKIGQSEDRDNRYADVDHRVGIGRMMMMMMMMMTLRCASDEVRCKLR